MKKMEHHWWINHKMMKSFKVLFYFMLLFSIFCTSLVPARAASAGVELQFTGSAPGKTISTLDWGLGRKIYSMQV